jgi:hypothetical protein
VRRGPGEAGTILLLHIISARPSKQPRMVRTFLKVYMELGSYFVSARTNKRHHHHHRIRGQCKDCGGASICEHNRERRHCRDCGGDKACAPTAASGASARTARSAAGTPDAAGDDVRCCIAAAAQMCLTRTFRPASIDARMTAVIVLPHNTHLFVSMYTHVHTRILS